jgi:Na+-driven multidrug efflux pump
MTKVGYLVAVIFAILAPLAGGTFGCASRVQDLSVDNASWIVMWSMPFVALGIIVTAIVVAISRGRQLRAATSIVLLSFSYIVTFILAAWCLDGVSGV